MTKHKELHREAKRDIQLLSQLRSAFHEELKNVAWVVPILGFTRRIPEWRVATMVADLTTIALAEVRKERQLAEKADSERAKGEPSAKMIADSLAKVHNLTQGDAEKLANAALKLAGKWDIAEAPWEYRARFASGEVVGPPRRTPEAARDALIERHVHGPAIELVDNTIVTDRRPSLEWQQVVEDD